jgi:hypothetical protein
MIFQLGEVDQGTRKYNIDVVFPIALFTGPSPMMICTETHRVSCRCDELANRDKVVELACCTALYKAK